MSDNDIIYTLNRILSVISELIPIILLIIGTFGHLCNLIIFSKKAQRSNPTSLYFLSTTISNLISLYIGMFTRLLQDALNINLINTNISFCKIRSFFLYVSLGLSNWFILLATIDRYLISSNDNNRRQLSTLKNAYRSIAFLTISFSLCFCHIFILYDIQSSSCYPQYGSYRIFNDVQILIQVSLLPPILMTLFGILTIRNIRAVQRRIANTMNTRMRQRDIQLSKMLLLQVIIIVVCSFPFAISQLTTTMTLTSFKTPLRLAVENFISQIGRYLSYFNCSISFYLYTLAGSQFRLEIRRVINRVSMFMCQRRILERTQIGIDPRPFAISARRQQQND
jgi:hypothetical protein